LVVGGDRFDGWWLAFAAAVVSASVGSVAVLAALLGGGAGAFAGGYAAAFAAGGTGGWGVALLGGARQRVTFARWDLASRLGWPALRPLFVEHRLLGGRSPLALGLACLTTLALALFIGTERGALVDAKGVLKLAKAWETARGPITNWPKPPNA